MFTGHVDDCGRYNDDCRSDYDAGSDNYYTARYDDHSRSYNDCGPDYHRSGDYHKHRSTDHHTPSYVDDGRSRRLHSAGEHAWGQ